MKKLSMILAAMLFSLSMFANTGFFTYASERPMGIKILKDAATTADYNYLYPNGGIADIALGSVTKVTLNAAYAKVWKSDGDDITAVALGYNVHKSGEAKKDADDKHIALSWSENLKGGDTDQEWKTENAGKVITTGLTAGEYVVEFWYRLDGKKEGYNPWQIYAKNGETSNFKITFTLAADQEGGDDEGEGDDQTADKLYLMGDIVEGGWAPNKGEEMTYDEATKVYTITKTIKAGQYFGFTTKLASQWDDIASSRIGAGSTDVTLTVDAETDIIAATDKSFTVSASGEYLITVNLTTKKVKVTKKGDYTASEYYIKHDANGWTWVKMTKEEGVFVYVDNLGESGANINDAAADTGAEWFPIGKKSDEGRTLEVAEGTKKGDVVRFVYDPATDKLTATVCADCEVVVPATGFGLQVNGKDVIKGEKTDDFVIDEGTDHEQRWQQYKVLGVELKKDDIVLIYDLEHEAPFFKHLDENSTKNFKKDDEKGYVCLADGKYDFYIKLQSDNDILYVGEAGGSTGEVGEGDYYIKNNWGNTTDWTWKAMEKQDDGTYTFKGVFGGMGCNVWTEPTEAADVAEWYELSKIVVKEGTLVAGATATFIYDPEAKTLSAVIDESVEIVVPEVGEGFGLELNGTTTIAGTRTDDQTYDDITYMQYSVMGIDLKTTDKIKAYDFKNKTSFTMALDSYLPEGVATVDGEGNISVMEDGKYNFYLKIAEGHDNVWIEKADATDDNKGDDNEDPVVTPIDPDAKMYIIGEVNGNSWATNVGVEMTLANGKYVAKVQISGYFSFTTKLADTAEDWTGIADYRLTPTGEEDVVLTVGVPAAIGAPAVDPAKGFTIEPGEYTLTVDINAMTVTATQEAENGIEQITVTFDTNAPMYNTLGQRVGADYKGIVIQNGKKFLLQ